MVNLLIAQILPHDQMKYAEECLDLLDILQQDKNGDVSDNIKNIISIAEDLVEELEIKQQEAATAAASDARRAVIDPATEFFSDPSTSPSSEDHQDSTTQRSGDDSEMKDVVGQSNGEKAATTDDAGHRGDGSSTSTRLTRTTRMTRMTLWPTATTLSQSKVCSETAVTNLGSRRLRPCHRVRRFIHWMLHA